MPGGEGWPVVAAAAVENKRGREGAKGGGKPDAGPAVQWGDRPVCTHGCQAAPPIVDQAPNARLLLPEPLSVIDRAIYHQSPSPTLIKPPDPPSGSAAWSLLALLPLPEEIAGLPLPPPDLLVCIAQCSVTKWGTSTH